MYLTVVPAYGRDYNSKRAVLEDWNANKDFTVQDMSSKDNGRAVNKEDLARFSPGTTVNIRYKKLTMVAVVKPEVPTAVPTEAQADDAYARRVMGLPPHPRNEPRAVK